MALGGFRAKVCTLLDDESRTVYGAATKRALQEEIHAFLTNARHRRTDLIGLLVHGLGPPQ